MADSPHHHQTVLIVHHKLGESTAAAEEGYNPCLATQTAAVVVVAGDRTGNPFQKSPSAVVAAHSLRTVVGYNLAESYIACSLADRTLNLAAGQKDGRSQLVYVVSALL